MTSTMAARVHPKDLGKDKHTSNGQDIFKYVEKTHVILLVLKLLNL